MNTHNLKIIFYFKFKKRNLKKQINVFVLSIAVLSNGDLVSGGDDSSIKIWGANEGLINKTLNGHKSCIWD